jgi:hypothetical protein
MRINFLCKAVVLAATLCVAPAALPKSPKAGASGGSAVAANTAVSPKVSAQLLEQIRIDAWSVEDNADQLQMLLREGSATDKQDGAPLVDDMRDHVNQMNKLLSYLRVHQAEASPLQKQIIEQVAAPAIELADTTSRAIDVLNNDGTHLSMSDLPGLADAIYNEASRVDQTVEDFDKYVHARHEERQLGQTLGLKNNS